MKKKAVVMLVAVMMCLSGCGKEMMNVKEPATVSPIILEEDEIPTASEASVSEHKGEASAEKNELASEDNSVETDACSIADLFVMELPEGWKREEGNADTASWMNGEKEIARLTIMQDCEYTESVSMLVRNCLEMDGNIVVEKELKVTEDGERVFRVEMELEPSAAEGIAGVTSSSEIHYFYISANDLFVDVWVTDADSVEAVEKVLINGLTETASRTVSYEEEAFLKSVFEEENGKLFICGIKGDGANF